MMIRRIRVHINGQYDDDKYIDQAVNEKLKENEIRVEEVISINCLERAKLYEIFYRGV
jgi:hypothetical protein